MRQDLGFFTFIFLGDAEAASKILTEALQVPGAPYWLGTLAAEILIKGGDRAAARRMWQEMAEQADSENVRLNALDHLRTIDTRDHADRLQEALVEYERRFGTRPRDLAGLVAAGVTREAVVDASGTPFAYDVTVGKVSVSPKSPLWRPN
jgi:hypothetical protein